MANKYYRLNTTAANIRQGAGANYASLGFLVRDDVVEVAQAIGSWSQIVNAQHVDGSPVMLTGDGTVVVGRTDCWSTNAYFVEVPGLPNPPVVEPDPGPTPAHVVEVYVDGTLEFRKELP